MTTNRMYDYFFTKVFRYKNYHVKSLLSWHILASKTLSEKNHSKSYCHISKWILKNAHHRTLSRRQSTHHPHLEPQGKKRLVEIYYLLLPVTFFLPRSDSPPPPLWLSTWNLRTENRFHLNISHSNIQHSLLSWASNFSVEMLWKQHHSGKK